jgi:hypothetical protein
MLHLDRAARLERDRRRRGGGSRSHDFCPAALNCAVSARRVPRFPARPAALGMAPMRTTLGQPLGEAGGNRHRLSVGHRRLGSAPPDGVKVNTRTIRAAFRGAATPCLAQKRPYSSFPAAQRALGLPWRFPGRSQPRFAMCSAQGGYTPGYTESGVIPNGFALTFNGRDATDTRSELGARIIGGETKG